MPAMHKVIVLLETSHEYGRGLMRGIVHYARLNGPWSLHMPPWSIHEDPPRVREIQASGVIARITSSRVARALKKWKLPAIVLEATAAPLAPTQERLGFCEIHTDSAAIARMAAGHLEEAGYQAAELLDGLMSGRIRGRHEVPVRPTWVHERRSTDVIALADREIGAAMRFIRDHANQCVGVDEVVDATGLSRRTLERRFRRQVGRSILEELSRCRLERAKRLLLETELTVEKAAYAAGFANLKPMLRAFRQGLGCSPTAYRQSKSCMG